MPTGRPDGPYVQERSPMGRVQVFAGIALASAALFWPTAGTAGAASPSRVMVHRINAVRAAHGLPRLRSSGSLRHSARHYARHLMRSGVFAHASRIHASRRFSMLGEILEIHYDRHARAGFALNQWMHSWSHAAAILNPRFRWIGAGRTSGRFRAHGATIWV